MRAITVEVPGECHMAIPADSGTGVVDTVPLDKVRALQHTLYRTAKADPGRRFHALWDKVLRRDVLWRAWVAVRANNGAPGIDRTTLDWIEKEYGIDRLLDELSSELRDGVVSAASGAAGVYPQAGNDRQAAIVDSDGYAIVPHGPVRIWVSLSSPIRSTR